MSKKLKKPESVIPPPAPSSTRNAVESSIDLSKGDKSITWEKSASKNFDKITKWENAKKNQHEEDHPSP